MNRPFRILLSAYACEPDKGSEPEAGWQWAVGMARIHNVTVITRWNNAPAIQQGLKHVGTPHPVFRYYDLPTWLQRLKGNLMSVHLYYALWQVGARWHFRRQLPSFDLIHHVTFNSYRWAGFWWGCQCAVILGPLGGGQTAPWRMLPLFGLQAVSEMLRSVTVWTSVLNPLLRLNYSVASRILLANRDTGRRIPHRLRNKTEVMLDAAMPSASLPERKGSKPGMGLRVIWAGALQKRKAARLALHALQKARQRNTRIRLTMVGDGPDAISLRSLAAKLGIGGAVEWAGRQPRQDLRQLLAEHDVFLFTSVRDTSGYVVLEAMQAGLPVVTLRHQGAEEMTTDLTAIRVIPSRIRTTAQDLANALIQLANDAERRQRMGAAGFTRVQEYFLWEHKVDRMLEIYEDALRG